MSANVDTMFSVREVPWHGLGYVPDREPRDRAEARKWAGLEWEPELMPAYKKLTYQPGEVLPDGAVATGTVQEITATDPDTGQTVTVRRAVDTQTVFVQSTKTQLVLRNDSGDDIGRVGTDWQPMYHDWMFEIVETIVGNENVHYETAGSLAGGASTWVLVRLDEPVEVAGDDSPSIPYLVLLNSHDGSGSVKVLYTTVRVVCWNTYSMASFEGDRTGYQYVFRHQGDMRSKVDAAKEALSGLRTHFAEWIELATELAATPVDDQQVADFTKLFIPEPQGEVVSDRVRGNIDKARATFGQLYSASVTTDGHRGSALGLLDASVEYLDHVRKAMSRDTLLNRTLLKPEPMKRAALGLICEITGKELVRS